MVLPSVECISLCAIQLSKSVGLLLSGHIPTGTYIQTHKHSEKKTLPKKKTMRLGEENAMMAAVKN